MSDLYDDNPSARSAVDALDRQAFRVAGVRALLAVAREIKALREVLEAQR